MKKNILPIIIVVLVVAQFVSMSKVSNLQMQLDSVRSEIANLRNNIQYETNTIYANVDERLREEASLIEIASIELGTLDIASLTVPVKVSITPKEVSEYTALSLAIDGEQIPMSKRDTAFYTTINRDIFSNVSPLIVIDENGVKKTTQDGRIVIENMKDSLLPMMYPHLSGEAGYRNGIYECKKTLQADVKNAISGIVFTEVRFVIKVDEEIISDEVVPADALPASWQVDRTIPLHDGQVCIMTVIATDSIGLTHHYTVDHWIGGANAQREPWFDDEQIYSPDGKLLWKSDLNY